jgi:hypothetical protein
MKRDFVQFFWKPEKTNGGRRIESREQRVERSIRGCSARVGGRVFSMPDVSPGNEANLNLAQIFFFEKGEYSNGLSV